MKRLFILGSLLLLVSCTITKRHFGPGYHLEWKKTYPKTEKEIERLNITDPGIESSTTQDENDVISVSTDTVYHAELISSNQLALSIEEPETPVQLQINPVTTSDQISDDEVPVDEPKRKVEPFTWAALGSLFLCLLLLLTIEFDLALGILVGLGILMIVFSIISLIRIVRRPESYKAKGLTWTLFWLSMVGIGGILGILIIYLLIITNNIDLL